MTWVNLDDVYVSTSGGTINGNLAVNGNLTCKNGSTTYNVGSQLATLGDSVSQATSKTEWAYLYQDSKFGQIKYCRWNELTFVFISVSGVNNTWECNKTLPSGFRPSAGTYFPLAVRQSNACAMAWIGSDGLIQIYNYGGSSGVDFLCNYICYPSI